MSLFHLYIAMAGAPEALVLRGTHLALVFCIIFLAVPKEGGGLRRLRELAFLPGGRLAERLPRLWDLLLLAAALAPLFYIFLNLGHINSRMVYVDSLAPAEMAMGVLLVLLVLEASRRTLGPTLPITVLVFILYALAGPWLPGPMRHAGLSLETLFDIAYFSPDGVFGIPLGVSATYVVLFIIFGAFLERTNTGALFMDLASALAGRTPGGPGKIACISSGLFGTISGSAVANVMVDGWLTIPLMKRTGFKGHVAAAVEAVASTGGQIMPPVMGAAAFVLAELAGLPYVQVAIHAAIPALLYYLALFMAIHFEARRTGLRGLRPGETPPLGGVLLERGHMLVPILALIWLMWEGYTAFLAAFWATLLVVGISALRAGTRLGPKGMWEALQGGAQNSVGVAAACASAGIVIGVIAHTGLGIKFTSFILSISEGSLIPALALTMVAGIILGMGMPTTAAYVMQAALLVPALMKLGVVPIAAHLFVFYFAIISAITPPVALAVYAAAGIGKTPLWATGLAAVRMGATGFIVPFFFVYGPALLLIGSWGEVVLAVLSACAGVILLAAGLHGFLLAPLRPWERLATGAAALLLIHSGWKTDLIGLALAGAVLLSQRLAPLPEPPAAVPAKPGSTVPAGR
ncbi:MAG: TRAP transporter permease [Candidatus Tectomicrobia bacterium]|nr:TRAP transporter permease [Candidatus Tectomicrobia bacterium]